MSKIEIDFNNMKYNLYEILNVSPQAEEIKIKKSFMKLIKNFHPDKNSELEEEIYYHIILANQILLNKDSRKKYDNFLADRADTFDELKQSFNKTMKNVNLPNKDTSIQNFNTISKDLNIKHGYNINSSSDPIVEQFNKIKQTREKHCVIEPENIKSNTEFNTKFNVNKTETGKFKDQLVEYKGDPAELSTYVIGEYYTNLGDIDKLYVEDSVQSSKFSSLDHAFSLHTINIDITKNKTYEDKLKEYQAQTEKIKNMKTNDFSNIKY
jgi:curved DNA-binding protein CbpA